MKIRSMVTTLAAAGAATGLAMSGAPTAEAVIGGEQATTPYSFMGSLNEGHVDSHRCGVTLIAPQWAVTARHCINDQVTGKPIPPADLQVRFGSLQKDAGGTIADIEAIPTPPPNPMPYYGTDIALIKLKAPISNTPAKIAATAGTGTTRIIGWGRQCTTDYEHCQPTPNLNQMDVKRVSDLDCLVNYIHVFQENCYSPGASEWDSGGPALVSVNGEWQVVGAAGRLMAPGGDGRLNTIYTDVVAWRQWIRTTTGIPTL